MNKVWSLFVLIAAVVAFSLGFSSCGEGENTPRTCHYNFAIFQMDSEVDSATLHDETDFIINIFKSYFGHPYIVKYGRVLDCDYEVIEDCEVITSMLRQYSFKGKHVYGVVKEDAISFDDYLYKDSTIVMQ